MKRTFGSFFLFVFLNLLGINQTLSLQWMNEENHYLFAMQFDDYPTPPLSLLLFVPFNLQELQAWPGPPSCKKLWL